MMKIKLFRDFFNIEDEEILHSLLSNSDICHLKKGEVFIESGKPFEYIYFIIDGVFRGFVTNYNGKDITDCFRYKYGEVMSPSSELGVVSPVSIQALSKATVVRFPALKMQELLARSPQLSEYYRRLILASANEHWELKMTLCQYSAPQRYLWFLKKYPGLIDRVNNRYIASFLNITPVTLSRIRGEIKHENAEFKFEDQ